MAIFRYLYSSITGPVSDIDSSEVQDVQDVKTDFPVALRNFKNLVTF